MTRSDLVVNLCSTHVFFIPVAMPFYTHRGMVWMMKIVCPRTDSFTSTLVSDVEDKMRSQSVNLAKLHRNFSTFFYSNDFLYAFAVTHHLLNTTHHQILTLIKHV